ncbi:MAG: replication-relaxation family protein [Armatimonas sp.]
MKLDALRLIAESRFLSTPQVAGLMGISEHAARGHLRDLFDMGLTDVVAVPGVAVGSKALIAAKVHYPTKAGLSELDAIGCLPQSAVKVTGYSPRQYAFLGHELAIRETLVWLTIHARLHPPQRVTMWNCSGNLQALSVRPDAIFHYDLGEKAIAGILEVDMGSERGTSQGRFDRWAQKAESYAALYDSEVALRSLVGTKYVRIVVSAPNEERAAWIAQRLEKSPIAEWVWIGRRDDFTTWIRHDGRQESFFPESSI